MTTRDPRRESDEQLEEAREIEATELSARQLIARLTPRVEYSIRVTESVQEQAMELRETQLEQSEQLGKLLGELGYLRTVVGEEPDLVARPPRAGSGMALRLHYLWADFMGRAGKPAVGAAVGGGAVYGLIELAKAILEAVR